MSQYQTYVFVLWGDYFDEVSAAVLVTELRKVGLRVKVVGLHPHRICGAYGLALVPDLTLDQALHLARQVICLAIPQKTDGLQSLTNDPRLHRLFALAHTNRAKFVIGPQKNVAIRELDLFPASVVDQFIVCPEREGVITFARMLAMSLLEKSF